jgi:hypothetical protein
MAFERGEDPDQMLPCRCQECFNECDLHKIAAPTAAEPHKIRSKAAVPVDGCPQCRNMPVGQLHQNCQHPAFQKAPPLPEYEPHHIIELHISVRVG